MSIFIDRELASFCSFSESAVEASLKFYSERGLALCLLCLPFSKLQLSIVPREFVYSLNVCQLFNSQQFQSEFKVSPLEQHGAVFLQISTNCGPCTVYF